MIAADLARCRPPAALAVLGVDRHARDVAHRHPRRRLRRGPGVLRARLRRDRPGSVPGSHCARPTHWTSSSDRSRSAWPARRSAAYSSAPSAPEPLRARRRQLRRVRRSRCCSCGLPPHDRAAKRASVWRTCATAGASSANAAGSGSTFASAAVAYLLFMGPVEVLVPYIVKHDRRQRQRPRTVFGAGGLASSDRRGHRARRARRPQHDLHVRGVDHRHAGRRRLRPRHRHLASDARQRALQRARDRRHHRLGDGQAAPRSRRECSAASRAWTG